MVFERKCFTKGREKERESYSAVAILVSSRVVCVSRVLLCRVLLR